MNGTPNQVQFEAIANQLSCPTGEAGLKTAENMAANNENMISTTIDSLNLQSGDAVLEIGPGSGTHVFNVFAKADGLNYCGVDISELMVTEAVKNNEGPVSKGSAIFYLSDGQKLAFEANSFDKLFTVNTLYFWNDPVAYAKEIFRVLKPGGTFCLCFAPKEFMEKLPFTGYIFKLYTLAETEAILFSAGFSILKSELHNEVVKTLAGEAVERNFIVITCTAP
jgi:ubiquinone/menaquinone biosynthesis C-methylase UbiE